MFDPWNDFEQSILIIMNYAYLLVLSQTYLQEYLLSNVYIGFKQINVNCILQLQNVSHVVYGLIFSEYF